MKTFAKLFFKTLELVGLLIFLCYLVASIVNEVRK